MAYVPIPKARWKELWTLEPTSVLALELQLVKLVEQALWAMVADPAFAVSTAPATPPADSTRLVLEPWMEEFDEKVAKDVRRKKKKTKQRPTLAPMVEEVFETDQYSRDESDEDVTSAKLATPNQPVESVAEGCETEVVRRTSDSSCSSAKTSLSQTHSDEALLFDRGASGNTVQGELQGAELSWIPPSLSQPSFGILTPNELEHDYWNPYENEFLVGEEPSNNSASDCRAQVNGESSIRPPLAQPASLHEHHNWQPTQLVCYIWNQTSQLSTGRRDGSVSPKHSPCTSAASPSRASASTHTPSTPWHRGLWSRVTPQTQTPLVSAVVRNTFISVDVDADTDAGSPGKSKVRCSRSLSPSLISNAEVQESGGDQWFSSWYWHQ